MDLELNKINRTGPVTRLFARLMLATALCAGFASAQEPSVIVKSLDDLEKRIIKVEGDLGRLKKNQAATPTPERMPARPDSALPRMSARLDSMLTRLSALETHALPKDTSPAPQPDEIASLVREVKSMIEILKNGRTSPTPIPGASAATAPTSAALPAVTAKPTAIPFASLTKATAGLELKGDVQIQGERKITSASSRNNLDDFWGRLNFGAEYNQGDFQSKINIRIFPEGFGFEPLTGATFDTTGQGSLKLQTQPSSRVVINNAWAKYAAGSYRIKFGRFETHETQSSNFGNYVDLSPGGKFLRPPAVHNAVELSRIAGPFIGSAMLGTNDGKLNRGFLRLYEKYAFSPKAQAAVGYRANIFDRFKYGNQEILQRFDLNLVLGLPRGWKAFTETSLLQVAGKEDETPVLVGIQPFTGKVLDMLSFETEYLQARVISKKNKEWLMNIHARKVMGRLKLESGISSDLADPAWNAFSLGFRVTSSIK